MMRFSRRRSSLSFPFRAVKTALNVNHACTFLPDSAVPAHRRRQEVDMQNASKPKMDESWTDCARIRLTDSLRSQVKGDPGKCCFLFRANPIYAFEIVCSSSCWSLSTVSRVIEMQQTPSLAQHLHLMSLAFWSFECSFLFSFLEFLRLPSLYFWKWMTQELCGFRQDETQFSLKWTLLADETRHNKSTTYWHLSLSAIPVLWDSLLQTCCSFMAQWRIQSDVILTTPAWPLPFSHHISFF